MKKEEGSTEETGWDEAISRFRQALTISEEVRDHGLIAAHMTQLGDAYRRKGDTEKALGLMQEADQASIQRNLVTAGLDLSERADLSL